MYPKVVASKQASKECLEHRPPTVDPWCCILCWINIFVHQLRRLELNPFRHSGLLIRSKSRQNVRQTAFAVGVLAMQQQYLTNNITTWHAIWNSLFHTGVGTRRIFEGAETAITWMGPHPNYFQTCHFWNQITDKFNRLSSFAVDTWQHILMMSW